MSVAKPALPLIAVAAVGAMLTACETVPMGGGFGPPPGPAPFRADDFAWSTRSGRAAIEGRIDYRRDGRNFDCTGSVALTPDTPYTRARFRTLYGSTDRAAVRDALERVRQHDGLVQLYAPPFTRERHEALGPQHLLMARYRDDGVLVPVGK